MFNLLLNQNHLLLYFFALKIEMAERHDMPEVLRQARKLVHQLQTIIEN